MIGPPRSLQNQILALVLGVLVIIGIATGIITWIDARHELEELLDSHLAQAAALLVVQQGQEFDKDPDDHHSIDAPILHRYAPKVAFQVFHEGHLALRSANAPLAPLLSADDVDSGFTTADIDGVTWRVFATRGGERDVQVYVGEQVESRTAILWAVLRSTVWPTIVALPLLISVIWWAVYRGFAPLRHLAHKLAERQPDALQPLTLDRATTELVPMVNALNDLFARIGALLESERRFTADAAHELRTPIAAIRAQAQVAMAESDDSLRTLALHNTVEGCDRAARLVEQLLILSKLEAAAAPPMTTIDLSAIARQAVTDLVPKAMSKHQQLELLADTHCNMVGNETLLAVLVRNLVDNALRYSPRSARVKVSVERHNGHIALCIEDSGKGLADADQQRLGERFFRVLGNDESGSGLGWSIVRRIAAVHQLDIQISRSTELGGLAVRATGAAIARDS
jgi:two-component system sensor histidine kinase QseC